MTGKFHLLPARFALAGLALWLSLAPTGALAKVELIMFRSQACAYCQAWDHDIGGIYHLTEEGERAPLRMVEMDKDIPADLEEINRVIYSPTFVLMKDDQEVGRILGYPGPDFFWPMLNDILRELNH